MTLAISYDDVAAAAQRLAGVAHRTPVLTSRTANELTGAELFFKCENFQRMGAFKFRGAYNALVQFTPEQRKGGVVAFSSGNHAQAIALSARLLGMPATIVMPQDAPAIKIEATRGYGAEVLLYDRYTEDREAISQRLSRERGMTLIPPYDHPHVMAGQGTAALELLQDVGRLDLLLVCVGGGGLISGCAIAAQPPAAGLSRHRRRAGSRQRRAAVAAAGRDRAHRRAAHDRRRRADPASRPLHVPGDPGTGRRRRDRQRRGAEARAAVLCGAHEDRRRTDRLPRCGGRLRAGDRGAWPTALA